MKSWCAVWKRGDWKVSNCLPAGMRWKISAPSFCTIALSSHI